MENVIKQQFDLAKYSNITLTESELMSDIDRNIYYSLLIESIKNESEI